MLIIEERDVPMTRGIEKISRVRFKSHVQFEDKSGRVTYVANV